MNLINHYIPGIKIPLQNPNEFKGTCALSRLPQEGNMYQAFNYKDSIKILSLAKTWMKFIDIVFGILQCEFVLLSNCYTLIGVHRNQSDFIWC